jgi:hypothetical protein
MESGAPTGELVVVGLAVETRGLGGRRTGCTAGVRETQRYVLWSYLSWKIVYVEMKRRALGGLL